jgi:hypothetical protein
MIQIELKQQNGHLLRIMPKSFLMAFQGQGRRFSPASREKTRIPLLDPQLLVVPRKTEAYRQINPD